MKTHKVTTRLPFAIFGALIFCLLAACQGEDTPTQTSIPSPHPAERTAAALQTENAKLNTQVAGLIDAMEQPPTATATQVVTEIPAPTVTPTLGPTVSVPEGLLTVTHAAAPGYLFAIDPEAWTVENTSDPANDFLVHAEVDDCTVNIAPSTAPSDLFTYYPQIFGRRGWLVEGYEENTFFIHQDLRLDLSITEDEDCIQAQETVLADVLTQDEFNGAPASTPAVRPTPRPALENFTCEDALPGRLRVGDRVFIVAGFLWLREEPRVEEATEIRLYQQYAPAEIEVTGGPICVDTSVFWEVSLRELVEGGDSFTGWMAENGGEEYFLDVWYLGW